MLNHLINVTLTSMPTCLLLASIDDCSTESDCAAAIYGDVAFAKAISYASANEVLTQYRDSGIDALANLDGGHAVAILDSGRRELHLFRDQWSQGSLYYAQEHGGILFSSHLPLLIGLLQNSLEPNLQAARRFLQDGVPPVADETYFNNIHQLLPGHLATISLDDAATINLRRFHAPMPIGPGVEKLSFAEAAVQTRELLTRSIALSLSGDAQKGFTLSGGLDSSAIVASAHYLHPERSARTYSYVTNERGIDEERYMDIVIQRMQCQPLKIRSSADEYLATLPGATRAAGTPVNGTSHFVQYLLYRQAHTDGMQVLLNGVKADSALAGHSYYFVDWMADLWQERQLVELARIMGTATWQSSNRARKTLALEIARRFPERISGPLLRRLRPAARTHWLGSAMREYASDQEVHQDLAVSGRSLQNHLRIGLESDKGARYAEANGAAFGMLSRTPYLANDLNRFVLSLPSEYLISRNGEVKHLFRESMRGTVPDEILDRRDKIGFDAPTGRWLQEKPTEVETFLSRARELGVIAENSDATTIGNARAVSRVISYVEWMSAYGISLD
ncbi:MAG: hypothetical protein KC435_08255 [Thermomicrobiales bacterium]|nr:hypothetical protein [Thermomicrobiales bacterium]